jgi:hypothetical protein
MVVAPRYPISTVVTVGTNDPGVAQQVTDDWAVAAGWPPNVTVGLPETTRPTCIGGAMYGSAGWSPTWGGVFIPEQPTTTAGLPAIWTVATVPIVTGAENGIGGPGCGTPLAGFGIWWIAHWPVILSPMTIAGAPIVLPAS